MSHSGGMDTVKVFTDQFHWADDWETRVVECGDFENEVNGGVWTMRFEAVEGRQKGKMWSWIMEDTARW